MRNLFRACIFSIALALSTTAPVQASPLGGKTINNVVIDGITYNVSFFDAALSQVVAPSQFTFESFAGASSAITAIINNAGFQNLIQIANTTAGTYYAGLIVPYGTFLPQSTRPTEYTGAVYQAKTGTIDNLPLFYSPNNDMNTTGDYTFVGYPVTAVATPGESAPAVVPEPSSIALVALGLFGFGYARRRT